jgi:hypothetical protein
MTTPLEQRLAAWREVARSGRPAWLAEGAPHIVVKLEAELAAQGIEARRATDSEAGVVGDESPVGNADAPNLNVSPNRSGGGDA